MFEIICMNADLWWTDYFVTIIENWVIGFFWKLQYQASSSSTLIISSSNLVKSGFCSDASRKSLSSQQFQIHLLQHKTNQLITSQCHQTKYSKRWTMTSHAVSQALNLQKPYLNLMQYKQKGIVSSSTIFVNTWLSQLLLYFIDENP